ncbi:MAG: class D beta-lactamase [Cyclobacteriaceae bacterium]
MIRRHSLFFLLFFSLCTIKIFAQGTHVVLPDDYSKHFQQYGVRGSLLIYDLKHDKSIYYNEERTRKRYSPASTFKIFNSLIGLESGVISDTSYVIPWDSVKRGSYAPWNRANSLNSAFKFSVVWYYQELARRVGKEEMQRLISLNKYGNENINDKIDEFWLSDNGGKLRISQVEQIEFLKKLYLNELMFSARSQRLVKDIMLMEQNDEYRLFAKTGMCSHDNLWYGWYVGWIETKENVYFFATHFESEDNKNILNGARKGITFAAFQDLGLIKNAN